MLNYQKRVIEEKSELNKKIKDLDNFINVSDIFKTIDKYEQIRIVTQLRIMEAYSEILTNRIDNF